MSLWNSFAPQFLNGIQYVPPDGVLDDGYDYSFWLPPDPTTGIALPAGGTVTFDTFIKQGAAFLLWGIELPPYSPSSGLYGYNASVQIYIDDEVIPTAALNTGTAYSNQSSPVPVLPQRWLKPGTYLRIVVTSFDVADYYNFQIVLRGINRKQKGGVR